jgi:hypothetical protein
MGARTSIDSSPILLQVINPDGLSYDPKIRKGSWIYFY